MSAKHRLAQILLVEDNEGDVLLTKEAFDAARFRNELHIARDGDEALDFLFQRGKFENAARPDIILLDLNLPKTDGKDVLAEIKKDEALKRIPTIILTSSESDSDVLESYDLNANCYVVKPVDAMKFMDVIQKVENFWIDIVYLPGE